MNGIYLYFVNKHSSWPLLGLQEHSHKKPSVDQLRLEPDTSRAGVLRFTTEPGRTPNIKEEL